jgi:general secretion pathway protein K
VKRLKRQRGAALLLAMLVVSLVATLASAALWQQWRAAEVESAERQRAQAGWILTGALDWARLILREDGRANQNSGNADHLGEPWAMPLEEARLSSFLAADRQNNADDTLQAFLSGEVSDQQGRLNFMNLVKTGGSGTALNAEVSQPDLLMFSRLYQQLSLPQSELQAAVNALLSTTQQAENEPVPSRTSLVPARLSQLRWLGISPASLVALAPHVSVLPERTTLNLNTASAQALAASVPGMDLATAQRLVSARAQAPFNNLQDVVRLEPALAPRLTEDLHGTRSRFFEVRGRLRLNGTVVEERSLVMRNNLTVQVLWRERIAGL